MMAANNPENSDQFLLIALKDGQEAAFDFIFRKYYKALCAQANARVNDLDLAQSLVQDCFIKLWEKRSQSASIENLSSYMSFMVRNRCIDYLRSRRHQPEENMDGREQADDRFSDTLLLSHEFEEKMVKALALLPDRCRIAFEYSRFDGLTYPEIAKKMDISVKAVEALISRSLKILRVELKDYLPVIILLYRITH
ncbi:RNA polymerase sigma factor [Gaoshiqia sp. Z1-71]|uniref:RNA polymerase sigma factor n=1 Tax=Gaoshiqia hydrogeniformans TaxID=3290090 RepID=UPI003BF86EC3